MRRVGIVFGGQGSQYENMGSLFLNHPRTKNIYKEISEYHYVILNEDLKTLSKTKNLQPIMLAFQLAALEFLKEENIVATCGLSLGEYGSLVLSGALDYKDALKLVKIRGSLMEEESNKYETKMLAVLNKNEDEIKEIISNFSQPKEIYISNINSPRQVVLAGYAEMIDLFKIYLSEKKIRFLDLAVSGAFHTKFMSGARNAYINALEEIDFSEPRINYYLNLSGKKYSGEDLKDVLADHINHPVRLFDDLKNMVEDGVDKIIEIGPGDVISKIVKKNFKDVEVVSFKNEKEIIKG